ncbi:hypothetical protein WSK_2481 [Novosphingobium sp. Rr 2-17]|uniref:hypothetical protein n=1 Tax=Novosphingobium sp. Rr 2-17 TaxID=555793 RepID=UPI000269AB67|nr:hypothetical protein [Novosphingobium sp. Rr 2-17]EIZ78938.1 hypothetical protein WSK_2481 [Novosphingobium sp. Rr 2-17]
MTQTTGRAVAGYWGLFALNLPGVCLLVYSAVTVTHGLTGMSGLPFDWKRGLSILFVVIPAFFAVRNVVRAHSEKTHGDIQNAHRMLLNSILAIWLYFVGGLWLLMHAFGD